MNYEPLNVSTDVTTTRTLLHETIPLTGTIVSGTYGTFPNENNIKNYAHGMFQSVYDYPYLSSSANHIFDVTIGYDESSFASASAVAGGLNPGIQNSKKINMYNQHAQVLLGYTSSTNTVEIFESDLNFADNNNQMKEVFIVNFSRLLTKDQLKKGSFSITLGTGSWADPFGSKGGATSGHTGSLILSDVSASATDEGTTNTRGGDYGVLFVTSGSGGTAVGNASTGSQAKGIVFYQAGIAIITASVFVNNSNDFYHNAAGTKYNVTAAYVSASITGSCDAIRRRIQNISFNNTTEINSTIYFCRVPSTKYNYSGNPTYTTGSKIRVKNNATDTPVSYITTIGLYSTSNELLAVAKLSEPLKKDNTNEITLRVRLDY